MNRYVNRQRQPVRVTGPNGSRTVLHPGQSTTDPWYSRFCSSGVLVEETSDGQAVHRVRTKAHPPLRVQHKANGGNVIPSTPKRLADPPSPDGIILPPIQLGIENGCFTKCEIRVEPLTRGTHTVAIGDLVHCRYCDTHAMDQAFVDEHVRRYHADKVEATERAIEAKAKELAAAGHTPDPPVLDPPGIVEIVPVPPAVVIIVAPEIPVEVPELPVASATPDSEVVGLEVAVDNTPIPDLLGPVKPEEAAFLKRWFTDHQDMRGPDLSAGLGLSRFQLTQRIPVLCAAGWLDSNGASTRKAAYTLTAKARAHLWPT